MVCLVLKWCVVWCVLCGVWCEHWLHEMHSITINEIGITLAHNMVLEIRVFCASHPSSATIGECQSV